MALAYVFVPLDFKPLNHRSPALGTVTDLLADTGYFSKANVQACRDKNIQPSLAVARDQHHLAVFDQFAPDDPAPVTDDGVEAPYTETVHAVRSTLIASRPDITPARR